MPASSDSGCYFCPNQALNGRRRYLHTLIKDDDVSSLMKVIWPMLFSERLSRVTTSNFVCQSCCQLLETASNRYKTFKLAVRRIEEAFLSSGRFPASYLTSAFNINVPLPPDDERSTASSPTFTRSELC